MREARHSGRNSSSAATPQMKTGGLPIALSNRSEKQKAAWWVYPSCQACLMPSFQHRCSEIKTALLRRRFSGMQSISARATKLGGAEPIHQPEKTMRHPKKKAKLEPPRWGVLQPENKENLPILGSKTCFLSLALAKAILMDPGNATPWDLSLAGEDAHAMWGSG